MSKVLGFMALHYGGDFFKESLLSVVNHVDKMHIAYSKNPSHGFSTELINPDTEWTLRKIAEEVLGDKLIWETYDGFFTEGDHRNTRYKHSVGYRYILTLDADEYFQDIDAAIYFAEQNEQRFYGVNGYLHFFKGFDYYFADNDRPIRLEKLVSDNKDQNLGLPLTVYHTSLHQDESLLRFKYSVFGHKNEVKPGYLEKILAWTPEKIDELLHLHPTRDDIWVKPTIYTGSLPEALKNHQKQEKRKMRILWIPMDFHRHAEGPELFADILTALNVSNDAIIYTNLETTIQFKPDVILYQASLSYIELRNLKSLTKALILMYTGDCAYFPAAGLVAFKDIVDGYLLPFSGQLADTYHSILGKPCFFLWESIQSWRFLPNQQFQKGAVSFVGNYYDHLPGGEPRKELVTFIKDRVPELVLAGNWAWDTSCDYTETPKIYNESYISICENNYETVVDYFTPRNIGVLAAGSCAVMKYFPGIDKFFQNNVHCLYYRNKYELLQAIQFLQANPAIRNKIADNGFKLANEKFTPLHWATDLTKIIKQNFLRHFE
jgi:hypothetical protein